MSKVVEVVIVGGGPIGLKVGQITADSGQETVVLEDKSVIGKPIQCAGLGSEKVIQRTGRDSVIAESRRADIYSA